MLTASTLVIMSTLEGVTIFCPRLGKLKNAVNAIHMGCIITGTLTEN
jgi:hypothetical protein